MFKTQTPLVSNKRTGFTLVELLVVIAIIAILVALSAGGVFKFLAYQKQVATDRTKDQVKAAIERVLKNIRTKAHSDYPNTPLKSLLTLIGFNKLQNNVPSLIGIREPNRRDELVFVDIQIARSFPLIFSDISANYIFYKLLDGKYFRLPTDIYRFVAFKPDGTRNNVNLVTTDTINLAFNFDTTSKVIPSIVQAFNSITGAPSLEIQNSACLLMALEANPDGLKGELLGTAVMTDPVTKARYIATADGQPICFQLIYLDTQAGGSKSVVGTVTVELIDP
jgi:prepilin-type N-terminal cleavage/methylation domain-containing protein